jgi:hypothetical protein
VSGGISVLLAACTRFGHDHEVFELQEIFEFPSLRLIQRVSFGAIQQVGDAVLRLFRRLERVNLLGRFPGHNEVDDLIGCSCREHDQYTYPSF